MDGVENPVSPCDVSGFPAWMDGTGGLVRAPLASGQSTPIVWQNHRGFSSLISF